MILNIAALTILFVNYLLITGVGVLNSDRINNIVRISCAVVLAFNLIVGRIVNKKFLYAGVSIALIAIASQSPLAVNILFLLLVAASLNKLNEIHLAFALLIPVVAVVVLHLLLLIFGITSNDVVQTADRTRSSFGFFNPNQVSAIYFSFATISVFFHLIVKRRSSFVLMIAVNLLAIYILIEADSRTQMIGVIIFAIFGALNYFFADKRIYNSLIYFFAFFSFIGSAAITIYLIGCAGTEIDIILSYRPYFFSEFMSDVSFWDIMLGWVDPNGLVVDNLFLTLLSTVGALGFILIGFFVTIRIVNIKIIFIPLVFSLLAVSIFESILLRPEIPVSILFFVMLFSPVVQRENRYWLKISSVPEKSVCLLD